MIREVIMACLLTACGGSALSQPIGAPPGVSQAAIDCAQKYLPDWRRRVTAAPVFHEVVGLESSVATARFEDPYRYYRLWQVDREEYVRSDEVSPLGFSSDMKYIFPIVSSDGVYLGAIKLIPNERGDGSKVREGECEFVMTGGIVRGGDVATQAVLEYRRSPMHAEATVDFVQFGRKELPGCLVITRRTEEKPDPLMLPVQMSKRGTQAFDRVGLASTEPVRLSRAAATIKSLLRRRESN